MQTLSLSSKQRYGIAVLSVVAAALLRALLEWLLKTDLYQPFFVVPIMAAAWYGGLWPGLLATGLSLLVGRNPEDLLDTKRLLVFVFTGVLVSILCAKARQVTIGITSDITERKNAEEKLKASEDRYRAFIANSSEGIWRYEMDEPVPVTLPADEQIELLYRHGYLAECNEVFARSHGRTSVDEILGERLTVLLVRSDAKKIIEASRLFVRSGYRLIGVETREVDPHGNTKYFLSNLIGILEDGKLVRAWGTQRDITAQKQTEDALRASEERMHRITDGTQDALWEINLTTKQLWWSEAARPLFGHSSGELRIGLSDWYDAIDPEDRERVRLKFEQLMSSDAVDWSDEYRFRRADGTYVDIHDRGRKFFDARGEPVWIAGAMVDITNRKAAEQALRLSEERFAKAFRASPDALVISRIADGVMFEVNDSFVELFGYSRKELIGKSTLSLDIYVDPAARDRAIKILRAEGRLRDFKVEVKRKSGEVLLFEFSAEPIDLRGEHCWVTLGKDITERERAEKEREQALEKEKAAREDAERSNRLKDEFLATISHELRTPLTAIRGWSQMLVEGTLPKAQMQHAFEAIERNAESQARLIDDLLDMSRVVTGRFNLEGRPIDIEQIFQAAVDVVRPSATAKRICLQAESDRQSRIIFGDGNRVHQILWNLLYNAVKFTNAGGRVDARLQRVGDRIEISISDTGIGIEPEFLPHVFDRFRQADSSSTRRYGGLGLGLAIVRYLAEAHGGTVSAYSRGKGQGSTFRVTFPLVEMSRSAQLDSRPSKPEYNELLDRRTAGTETLYGLRVLVVDDDPDTLDMLKFLLAQCEAEVTTASSAREALRVLEHSRIDVLVSDLAMPDEDGYDLICQVRKRARERGGNIPAIALSAYTGSEDRERALAAGFQLHLAKPIAPAELVSALGSFRKAA
jgi:PAS domain S-box-containing protein